MKPFLTAIIAIPIILLSACANLAADKSSAARALSTIGPYSQITARIMVMEPEHVWQAMLDWQSKQSGAGKIRIVHAASSRIVELRWHQDDIWLRDNQSKNLKWRHINKDELATTGIVISPRELSEFLGGHVPSGFQSKGSNNWIIHRNNSHIRVTWKPQTKRLVFSDIKHGRKATLVILGKE